MAEITKENQIFFGFFESQSFKDNQIHVIPSFGTSGFVETENSVVLFDCGIKQMGQRIINEIRKKTDKPIKYLVISHGHFDHAFGFKPVFEDAFKRNSPDYPKPTVIAHIKTLRRFKKYEMLADYHQWINKNQFASIIKRSGKFVSADDAPVIDVKLTEYDNYSFELDGIKFEIYPAMGETDDALWMYVPALKTVFTGDLFLWSFPNIGNPFKVQRYPKDWADSLREMLKKDIDILVPGHGPAISGSDNVKEALSITAEALDFVHDKVVERLNRGMYFEDIYQEMLKIYPEKFKTSKYLKPIYGCYEFAIHACYRLYHGWYDTGNATDLFPESSGALSHEIVNMFGEYASLLAKDSVTSEMNKENIGDYIISYADKLFENGREQMALHILDILIKDYGYTTNNNANSNRTNKNNANKNNANNNNDNSNNPNNNNANSGVNKNTKNNADNISKELIIKAIALKVAILKSKLKKEPSFIAGNIIKNSISALKKEIKRLKK